jgi:hypothetical protein
MHYWAVLLLPGLLLRALIPVGYMPMFGPGLSVGLMLCPAYAPIPASIGGAADSRTQTATADASATADATMDMSGMDMPMDMSASASTGSAPPHDSGSGHQDHTLCPYAASATLGAPPAFLSASVSGQSATECTLFAPQVAYFRLLPRAQSARGPPVNLS